VSGIPFSLAVGKQLVDIGPNADQASHFDAVREQPDDLRGRVGSLNFIVDLMGLVG
jgi:hypothetical protein